MSLVPCSRLLVREVHSQSVQQRVQQEGSRQMWGDKVRCSPADDIDKAVALGGMEFTGKA